MKKNIIMNNLMEREISEVIFRTEDLVTIFLNQDQQNCFLFYRLKAIHLLHDPVFPLLKVYLRVIFSAQTASVKKFKLTGVNSN